MLAPERQQLFHDRSLNMDTSVCYIAVMEDAGYDMSLCVAAVVDSKVMLCVDEPFEMPDVDQFSCDITSYILDAPTDPACIPQSGELRSAAEMFAASPTPASEVEAPTPVPGEALTSAPEAALTSVHEAALTSAPEVALT